MKTLILLMSVLFLSGCGTLGNILDFASEANDEALTSAEFTICMAASIGSINRRYNTEAKAKAWKELCTNDNAVIETILSND